MSDEQKPFELLSTVEMTPEKVAEIRVAWEKRHVTMPQCGQLEVINEPKLEGVLADPKPGETIELGDTRWVVLMLWAQGFFLGVRSEQRGHMLDVCGPDCCQWLNLECPQPVELVALK